MMNELVPVKNELIEFTDENNPLDWYCYKLKVTDTLTLMIGVNTHTNMIRIRGENGTIKTINGKLIQCWSEEPSELGEVFNV